MTKNNGYIATKQGKTNRLGSNTIKRLYSCIMKYALSRELPFETKMFLVIVSKLTFFSFRVNLVKIKSIDHFC